MSNVMVRETLGKPDCPRGGGHDLRAIFLMWVPAMPFVAVIATILLYIAPSGLVSGAAASFGWARTNPLLGGLAAAVLLWIVLAGLALAFRLTASDNANARSYSDLCQRLHALSARLDALPRLPAIANLDAAMGESQHGSSVERLGPNVLPEEETTAESALGQASAVRGAAASAARGARQQALQAGDIVATGLGRPGLSWVMGTGYINLWNAVHRAEEALIEFDLVENVITGAINDRMRIASSKIDADSQKQLIAEILQAVTVLNQAAVPYLGTQVVTDNSTPPKILAHVVDNPPMRITVPDLTLGPGGRAQDERLARATLRHVRFAIDAFRDGLWDGLVRVRNHSLVALTLSGVVTYVMLMLAVGSQLQSRPAVLNYATDPIVAATAYYLVGAIVGLFNVLNGGGDVASEVDDYGLSMARLVLIPVVSGLAAVLGVFLVAILPATFNGQVLSPSATPAPIATAAPTQAPVASAVALALNRPVSKMNRPAVPTQLPAHQLAFVQLQPVATPSPTNLNGGSTQAQPTNQQGTNQLQAVSTLDMVFNLNLNRFGLVIAAAFGLTPGLLISAIKRVPDEYKVALQSTKSTLRRS